MIGALRGIEEIYSRSWQDQLFGNALNTSLIRGEICGDIHAWRKPAPGQLEFGRFIPRHHIQQLASGIADFQAKRLIEGKIDLVLPAG